MSDSNIRSRRPGSERPDRNELWTRFSSPRWRPSAAGITIDVSRMDFDEAFLERSEPLVEAALRERDRIEAGERVNVTEDRMVGHYWLRDPQRAPDPAIRRQIEEAVTQVTAFVNDVHEGRVAPPQAARFTDVVLIGIGGSALGPQLVADGLGQSTDAMTLHFLDNTDPDGVDRLLDDLGSRLNATLVLVVSKSGGTRETHCGMLEMTRAFENRGLSFPAQAVAITQQDSRLDRLAREDGWLVRMPMWDWVGGRTSVTSAVGLLPAALQGVDVQALLGGAASMDARTRTDTVDMNPALLLALMWHWEISEQGRREMVVLPYKDRLLLLPRYLQQLVMESLGKRLDHDGEVVHQGITVYGNKGTTDQHAYMQQLLDGPAGFFATFLVVLEDRRPDRSVDQVEDDSGTTTGDYLHGFWQGTRDALYDRGRESISIMINRLDARSLGALIALYERAVGFYASFININAYDQPGVELAKKAAQSVIDIQVRVLSYLSDHPDGATIEALGVAIEAPDRLESIHHVLEHLVANGRGIEKTDGKYRRASVIAST
ncbi:MAG: glucose-6-phosphate isomerase [Phycisphaeraceae bacterium]|nr:glucose-6-phosphate isomerase [Phycisphaeraceae bacterium]